MAATCSQRQATWRKHQRQQHAWTLRVPVHMPPCEMLASRQLFDMHALTVHWSQKLHPVMKGMALHSLAMSSSHSVQEGERGQCDMRHEACSTKVEWTWRSPAQFGKMAFSDSVGKRVMAQGRGHRALLASKFG